MKTDLEQQHCKYLRFFFTRAHDYLHESELLIIIKPLDRIASTLLTNDAWLCVDMTTTVELFTIICK